MPSSDQDVPDRDAVLTRLDEAIQTAHAKVVADDLGEPDDERLQIQWIRALGYLTGQYRQLLKDKDLDEMDADLELIKDAIDLDR